MSSEPPRDRSGCVLLATPPPASTPSPTAPPLALPRPIPLPPITPPTWPWHTTAAAGSVCKDTGGLWVRQGLEPTPPAPTPLAPSEPRAGALLQLLLLLLSGSPVSFGGACLERAGAKA
eukprot:1147818-Pelagomonas_calceolata.AAC.8